MFSLLKNLLLVLAILSATKASAEVVTYTPMPTKTVKTAAICDTNSDCREINKMPASAFARGSVLLTLQCVGYQAGVQAGACQYVVGYCDDKNSASLNAPIAAKKQCAFIFEDEPACTGNLDCDDGRGCTDDMCLEGQCVNIGPEECTECLSDLDCDTSVKSTCEYVGEASWPRASHSTEICVPELGECVALDLGDEYCTNGCKDGLNMGCLEDTQICDDGNPCTVDTVGADFKCVFTVAVGTNCNDGKVCTYSDKCVLSGASAVCAGTQYSCSDNNACTTDSCDEASVSCVNTANTLTCDDGNACTTGDVCANKVCSGTAINCNDGDKCSVDSCVANTGACSNAAINCDDGDVCTNDACDPSTGECAYTDNVATCDDGKSCTTNDVCSAGVCAGTAKSCDDGKPCTTDSCGSDGNCVFTPFTDSTTVCSDGSACTTADKCVSGVCSGTAVVCNDNNACTTDSCNPASGCVFATISGCVPSTSCSLSSKTAGAGVRPLVSFSCQGRFTDNGQSTESTYTGTVGTDLYDQSGSGFYCWLKSLNGIPVNWGAMTTQAQKLAACKQAMVGLNACGQEVPISVTTDAWGACVVSFNTAP